MDVIESYRILELEIGAPRAAVDAAYCRLVERWHPDRAASDGAEAIREAQRMVQSINDAYHTLAKISPNSVKSSSIPLAYKSESGNQNSDVKIQEPDINSTKAPAPPPASAAPAVPKTKPKLPPLVGGQPSLGSSPLPPPPPSPETWAARSTNPAGAPPPLIQAAPSPPPAKFLPPPTAPSTPPPVAKVPPPSLAPAPVTSPSEPAVALPTAPSEVRRKLPGLYESLFPLGSPLRRFGPAILLVAVVFVILVGKCALSSSGSKASSGPDPKTTGRLIVKSNLASATIEAKRIPSPGSATTANVDGTVDQLLSGLPPGKYAVAAKVDGWREVHEEVNIEAERTTEVAMNFKGGSLRLDSDPTGATVRLGTSVLGRTPLVVPLLAPGVCQLSIEYPSWPVAAVKTTITEGVEANEIVRLPQGKLTVETTLPGTTVLLAGQALGQTPLTVERFPAGTRKLKLQAKDFPPLEVSVTVEDRGELKIHPILGSVFPVLDPATLLRAIWIHDDPDRISPLIEGVTGPFQSRNGVVKNLNRKLLFESWMRKRYTFTGIIKAYDPATGQIEFVEQQSDLSKHRVLAILSVEARNDPELIPQLTKGASVALYGRLNAVEEPRWPSKVISFELSSSEPLR
jgi:PEGA domain/DnaJ domain